MTSCGRILYLVDPDSFASLILVDREWRKASQTPHLYAHHLSRCPSFSLNNNVIDAGPFTDNSLPRLKRRFAQEIKRNLFESYLQPRRTFINLVSTNTNSSTAFPRGEAFDFIFSSNGHWTLALSSSRLYLVDTAARDVSVKREFKVSRRPISAALLDDGSLLAVLSSNQHVYVYDLANDRCKHLRSISLENRPHAIALSPGGDVLATAFDAGVEIYALAEGAADVERRIIKCDRVDSLTFSNDGIMLLGSTRNSKNPNTAIFTAPYLTDDNVDLPSSQRIGHMWTTQIVFPNVTRDCSHAILLPNRVDGDANWTFTYDRVFESFRAVRTDDLRNGTTYFTGPKRALKDRSRGTRRKKLIPSTLPAASQKGDLVSAVFAGKDIWLYGIPESLDIAPVNQNNEDIISHSGSSPGPSRTSSNGTVNTTARSITRGEASDLNKLPKWQMLVDKYHNVFAKGRKIAEIADASALCWVAPKDEKVKAFSLQERLVIAAPGGVQGDPDWAQDDFAAVDGGRLMILDFDRTSMSGREESVTFEVGSATPEVLIEETADLETEVAVARHRTVRRGGNADRRTVVDVLASSQDGHHSSPLAPTANAIANIQARVVTTSGPSSQNSVDTSPSAAHTNTTLEEAVHAFDGPYSQTSPRSRDSIYRSATAVAANRERNPPRILSDARVEYRRPGARGELPHESDADNWVPPPPPYAPNADVPLPEHLQRTLLPQQGSYSVPRTPVGRERPRRASTFHDIRTYRDTRRMTSLPDPPTPVSESQEMSRSVENLRPVSPLSTSGISMSNDGSEVSGPSKRVSLASSSTSGRRPMSEYVTRLTGSLRRPQSTRYTADDIPPIPQIPQRHFNSNGGSQSGSQRVQRVPYEVPMPAIAMPSAEQLANLNSHSRKPPSRQITRQSISSSMSPISLSPGSILPAPPRGALGAAGNASHDQGPNRHQSRGNLPPTPPAPRTNQGRSLSTLRNPMARSSPALLRPTPKRLDTIESVSSFVSRSRTRSRSRDVSSRQGVTSPIPPSEPGSGDPRSIVTRIPSNDLAKRRSQSAGPALRLDRLHTSTNHPEGENAKRGFFGGGRKAKKPKKNEENDQDRRNETPNKDGKCLVM